MFKKKQQTESVTTSIEQLLDTAMTLKYVGDFLLQGQVQGYECEPHLKALAMVKGQFDAVNADVEKHADYPKFLEEQKAKREASKAKAEQADA